MIYKKNKLSVDGIKVDFIAKKFTTPIYCYSFKKLRENVKNWYNKKINS